MKTIEVVAAIIIKDEKVFATQRGYGEFIDGWEFPGGKVEAGEALEDALLREIREELAAEIIVKDFLTTVEYDYPNFHLTMHCFICEMQNSNMTLLEHKAAKWLNKGELDTVDWLPADLWVVEKLKEAVQRKPKA